MADWALFYRSLGLPIFPVCPALVSHTHQERTRQGERVFWQRVTCTKMGKTPLVAWAEYQARVPTAAEVEKWWRQWPSANIGLACGEVSGVVVVDLDGDLAVRTANDMGELPAGPFSYTGRVGGQHRFFAWRAEAPTLFSKRSGIDFRGQGGYVILPPSQHVSHATYRWVWALDEESLADLPRLPDWVIDLGGEREVPVARIAGLAGQGTYGWRPMTDIPEGTRDNTLMSIAGRLRGEDGLEEYEIGVRLEAINLEFCKPPVTLADVLRLAHSAAKYDINPPDEKLSGRLDGDAPDGRPARPNPRASEPDDRPDEQEARLRYLTLDDFRNNVAEAVEWVCGGLVGKGVITELTAYPKVGKTVFTLCLVAAMLRGDNQFCGRPLAPGKVLYLTEESQGSFKKELQDWGLIDLPDGLTVVLHAFLGVSPWGRTVTDALQLARLHDADLVIVDTLSVVAGVDDENDAAKAAATMKQLRRLADAGFAVLYLRHDRKSGGSMGQSGRGSSAYAGAADILLDLNYTKGDTDGAQRTRELRGKGRFGSDTPAFMSLVARDGFYEINDSPPVTLTPPRDGPILDTWFLLDQQFRYMRATVDPVSGEVQGEGVTATTLANEIHRRRQDVEAELKLQIDDGFVLQATRDDRSRAKIHWLRLARPDGRPNTHTPGGGIATGTTVEAAPADQTEMELE